MAGALDALGVVAKGVAAVAAPVALDPGGLLARAVHQPRAFAPALQYGAAAKRALSRPFFGRAASWQETQQQYWHVILCRFPEQGGHEAAQAALSRWATGQGAFGVFRTQSTVKAHKKPKRLSCHEPYKEF